MSSDTELDVTVVELTEQSLPLLTGLFGPTGAADGCWCMWFRRSANDFKRNKGESNRAAIGELAAKGEPVGLLVVDESGQAVGWVAVAPRLAHVRLDRSAVAAPPDPCEDLSDVWSVTCFFVHRRSRGNGVTRALLRAALRHAVEQGARCVEGYPTDTEGTRKSAGTLYHGTLAMFLDAGFELVGRRGIHRALVRKYL